MHNVFARLDTMQAAENARQKLLGGIDGISRIGIRPFDPPFTNTDYSAFVSDAIAPTVVPESGIHSVSRETAHSAAIQEAVYDRRTGYEMPRSEDYLLCAQGTRDAVEHAAELLRSLGARSIDVRDSKGDFFDGSGIIE